MKKHLSKISLVISNLVPIYGVIYLGWSFVSILYLYWFENIILAFFTILKILWAKVTPLKEYQARTFKNLLELFLLKFLLILIFVIHFGGATLVHMFILRFVFGKVFTFQPNYLIMIIFMFVSHGISFVTNYIQPKTYLKTFVTYLMFNDYSRIIVGHLMTMLIGATLAYKNSLLLIIMFTLLRTIIDLFSHIYQYNERSYYGLSPFAVNLMVAGYKKQKKEGTLDNELIYPPWKEMINEILRKRGVDV